MAIVNLGFDILIGVECNKLRFKGYATNYYLV